MKTRFVLLLVLLGAAGQREIALAQSPGMFSVTGDMTTPRYAHTATLLPNGKVLVAGGIGSSDLNMPTAELYDPSTGRFTATGNMTTPRVWHSATLLPDGKVLIAGGEIPFSVPTLILASAELYDPSTGAFTATDDMTTARECQGATLLTSGKVLIAGGTAPVAELYDPATGTFSPTGKYSSWPGDFNTCQGSTSTLLQDGRVLIVWGTQALGAAGRGAAAELYDPDSGTFTATGTIALWGYFDLPTATLLTNGKVLVAGGEAEVVNTGAELYDSSIGTFTATPTMITGHAFHTDTLLPDGTVLLAGGYLYGSGDLANAELYSPVTGAFAATGNMTRGRDSHAATLLNDGRVLITGGSSPFPAITSSAEIYRPVVLVPAPQLFSVSGDGQGQGAILHAGTARVVTAGDPGVPGEALEIYGTGLQDGSVIPPQVAIGGRLAEILYFGNAPGFPALNQVNVRVPRGIAPGAGVPVRLMYLGRSSNAVTIGVQ